MTLRDRLQLMPEGTLVPAAWVLAQLEREQGTAEPQARTRDLRLEEVAAEVGRSPSTVRNWLNDGSLRGYKLKGKSWRVQPAALREFLDREAKGEARTPPAQRKSADLGAWRQVKTGRDAA